jgi:hypothetical protein
MRPFLFCKTILIKRDCGKFATGHQKLCHDDNNLIIATSKPGSISPNANSPHKAGCLFSDNKKSG